MDDPGIDKQDASTETAPSRDDEPADPEAAAPGTTKGRDPVAWTLEEDAPRAKDRQRDRSEAGGGPIAPPREKLEDMNRDELLERAAELGLNVDPEIERQTLIDKLSRREESSDDARRETPAEDREVWPP